MFISPLRYYSPQRVFFPLGLSSLRRFTFPISHDFTPEVKYALSRMMGMYHHASGSFTTLPLAPLRLTGNSPCVKAQFAIPSYRPAKSRLPRSRVRAWTSKTVTPYQTPSLLLKYVIEW